MHAAKDEVPPSWMDTLHAFPELAAEIGQYMATFASVERLLWSMYGAILGSDDAGAIALMGHIESFSIRLTAVENFLPYSTTIARKRKETVRFLQIARECNEFRNVLAHGLYLSDEKGKRIELVSYATDTKRKKPKQLRLTTALLSQECGKLFALRDGIRNLYFPEFGGAHRPVHIR